MAGVIEGEHALERAAIVPSVKRKSLKDPARKIRYEMPAKQPAWTEFQLEILASYANLRADYEADPSAMPNSRIVKMKRQAKLLLAPRGEVGDDGGKAP